MVPPIVFERNNCWSARRKINNGIYLISYKDSFIKTTMTTTSMEKVARTMRCLQCDHRWATSLQGRDPLACPFCRTWYYKSDPQFVSESERARIKTFLLTGKHSSKKHRK